jgi:dTMP kinase
MFIAFDGIDGTGKSTQIALFQEWMQSLGHCNVTYRDPGTTRLGESLRDILLRRTEIPLDPLAESLIYMASRAALVSEVIEPALRSGVHIVGDRYVLANVAYQGYGLQLGRELLWQLGAIATRGIMPDLTLVLDLDVDMAAQRRGVASDRLEEREREFHQRVRDGFLREAELNPASIQVVPVNDSAEHIHRVIREIVLSRALFKDKG